MIETILGVGGLIVGVCAAIWKVLVPAWKFLRKAVHVTDIMVSIPDRLTVLEERSAELVTNHGSSLRDAVDRIEQRQADQELMHSKDMAAVRHSMKNLSAAMTEYIELNETRLSTFFKREDDE